MPRISSIQKLYNISTSFKLSDTKELIKTLEAVSRRKRLSKEDREKISESLRKPKIKLLAHRKDKAFLNLLRLEEKIKK